MKKIGLGGAMLGSVSGLSYEKSIELLELAYSKGVRFYDTANIYGQGDSERAIGQLYEAHDDIIFGTKAGYGMPTSGSSKGSIVKRVARLVVKKMPFLKKSLMKMRSNVVSAQDFSYEAVSAALSASLERLKVKQIPIYMLHSPSKLNLEDENFCTVLDELKSAGKIKKSGLALMSVNDVLEVKQLNLLDVVQVELNLLSPVEHFEILEKIKNDHDLTIVVRQPFAGGKLLQGDGEASIRLKKLKALAEKYDFHLAQLALAGLASISYVDHVLVGTTKPKNLASNVEYATCELPRSLKNELYTILGI